MEQVVRAVKCAGRGLPCWREDQLARTRQGEEDVAAAWASLTQREQEVARLLAQGLRNADMAETLGVSVRTVFQCIQNF